MWIKNGAFHFLYEVHPLNVDSAHEQSDFLWIAVEPLIESVQFIDEERCCITLFWAFQFSICMFNWSSC
jgi:hypothetical protein